LDSNISAETYVRAWLKDKSIKESKAISDRLSVASQTSLMHIHFRFKFNFISLKLKMNSVTRDQITGSTSDDWIY
jgi:hypothetical protein